MRIDFEKREAHLSVGDLVQESTYRRIGVERGDGFRRMWLGQEAHSRRAESQLASDPNYKPEVTVTHSLELNGWSLHIAGRIDGVSIDREAKRIAIEEVKSLHFDLELEALYRSEKLQRHLYQLMLYAFFLSHRSEFADFELEPRLVLIDIATDRIDSIAAAYEREDVASAFDASVHRFIDQLESDRALQVAKRAFADQLTFPFGSMRPHQQQMVEEIDRAVRQRETILVSAPTGIGKTIAAIYPALRQALQKGKKLFFLTSKTLQQEAAVAALKMLNDGSFRVLTIRAKQKMCAHSQMICHEDFCPFAARYAEKMQKSNLLAQIVDNHSYFEPDLTYELSRSTEVCPFEVSLELIDEADVVICDYNYVFDPYVGLKSFQQDADFSDSVIIIDEAHNLVDRGRNYYSPELHQKQIDDVERHLAMRPGAGLEEADGLIEELREIFRELGTALEPSIFDDGVQAPTNVALCEPSKRDFLRQRTEWERLVLRYIGWKIENRIADEDDPVIDFYFRLVKLANMLTESGDEFAHLIERTKEGLKLKVFCKDPSRFLGETIGSAHSVIAMSATLEPFEFYQRMLGFPRERTAELKLSSPFPRENRKILVINGVDTTYKSRASHYGKIAELIAGMSSSANGNFLALFPSYAFLSEVAERLPNTSKEVMIQRLDMTDWERRRYLDLLRDGDQSYLLLAVSGGMYAEGIDYQGEMLSGVFVVGPALPAVTFEQELLKRHYDEQYGAGFEYAYLIPGMTRVVQSAGRVIRSENDVGVIALLCKRFTQETYSRYFPSDWFDQNARELVTKKPVEVVREFLEERRSPQLRIRLG
jgi:DNA excision repair protein ERCC-2